MASDVKEGSAKIWFNMLKMAIQHGLPINDEFYREWGTREELASLTFNQWWKQRGKQLFLDAVPKVSMVEASEEAVVIRIPASLNSVQVKKQVSALIAQQRETKRLKQKAPLSFVGDVDYRRLRQYERYLKIELDPRNAGKTIEQKTELLRNDYRKTKARMDKQRKTLRERGNSSAAKKFLVRELDAFGSEAQIRKGIDAKKVSRWRLSGKLLLLNAAEGQFPGKDYYGARLAERLRTRLARLGLKDIGSVVRNKGGGVTRSQKTLVEERRTKVERDRMSLASVGASKHGRRARGGRSVGAL